MFLEESNQDPVLSAIVHLADLYDGYEIEEGFGFDEYDVGIGRLIAAQIKRGEKLSPTDYARCERLVEKYSKQLTQIKESVECEATTSSPLLAQKEEYAGSGKNYTVQQIVKLNQNQPIQIDFTKGVVSQDDLLDIAQTGMALSFEVKKDEKEQPYLVVYFHASPSQYRISDRAAFVAKCLLVGSTEDQIGFVAHFCDVVTTEWSTAITRDKLNALLALTE